MFLTIIPRPTWKRVRNAIIEGLIVSLVALILICVVRGLVSCTPNPKAYLYENSDSTMVLKIENNRRAALMVIYPYWWNCTTPERLRKVLGGKRIMILEIELRPERIK